MADLGAQVAAAVHAVGVSAELRLARQHLMGAAAKDSGGASVEICTMASGPALAGLTFTLEAVRNLTNSDLQRADALLVSATDQVQTMIGDVRRLIYGLRPPTLDQLGLTASFGGLAARESSPDTHVTIEAPARYPLSPPPSRSLPTGSCRKRSRT